MNKRTMTLCLIVLLCLLFVFPTVMANDLDSNQPTANPVVLNDTDIGNDDSNPLAALETESNLQAGEGSLAELMGELSGKTEYTLTRNYKFDPGSDTLLTDGIAIASPIRIIGNNFIIDGDNQARIFNITCSNVVLTGITFQNAKTTGNGGAVLFTGSNGIMDNCTFKNNNASRGGAIFVQSTSVANSTNVTVNHCIFEDNYATVNGGALDWNHGAHQGTLTNSIFKNNIALRSGGAVYWYGENGKIRNVTFENNRALGLVEDIDAFGQKSLGGHGGAVIWTGADGRIENCTFKKNNASRNGGAIFMESSNVGNYKIDCKNITVSDCDFIENYAGINGGAVDWYEGAHDCSLVDSTFRDNVAKRSGGAVYWYGDRGIIRNVTFENNKAEGNVLYNNSYGVETYGGHGGAVMWTGADGQIMNSSFKINNASRNGGAIFMQGSVHGDCKNITVSGCDFVDNYAGINGGAVDWYEGAHDSYLKDSTFTNNTALRSGGAVYWYGDCGIIRNVTFENNKALGSVLYNNSYGVETYGGHGGAVMWTGADGQIMNSSFKINNASRNGGAIFMQGSVHGDCKNITVSGCDFVDNYAGINGGAVDWYEGAHDSRLVDSTFRDNTALRSGGAVYWYGDRGIIRNVTFENNKAEGNVLYNNSYGVETYGGHGGAIMWTGADGQILDSTFSLNNASRNGGAIFMQGSVHGDCKNITVSGCDFVDNYAGINGGAVDWYEGAHDSNLLDSTFTNNTAKRSGGAVYWYGHRGTINNVTFEDNRALGNALYNNSYGVETYGGDGGAVMWTGAEGNIINTTFKHNNASINGGAIFMQGSVAENCSNMTLNTCDFIDNVAGQNGGAVNFYTGSQDSDIINCNFINNTAKDAGGLFWNGHNGNVQYSKFINNTAGDDGAAIYWEGDYGLIEDIVCYNNTGLSVNTSSSRGGAVCLTGSNVIITKSEFTLNSVLLSKGADENKTDGGAIFITGNDVNITESVFSQNSAANLGGTIYIIGNDTLIYDCDFEKSEAVYGAVIYIEGDNATVDKSDFTNNLAREDGGAVFVEGHDCKISNSNFIDNTAYDDGGAIMWKGDRGSAVNIVCNNNKGVSQLGSSSRGGAICLTGSNVAVSDSKFNSNTVIFNAGADSSKIDGGALFITGNNVNITDCEFKSNNASHHGGTIYLLGDNSIVSNCKIEKSTAQNGGGVFIEGNNDTVSGKFKDMEASSLGGSIYVQGLNAKVVDSTFDNSKAYGEGGGAIYIKGNYATIEGSSFSKTYANTIDDGKGGAVYINGDFTLINNSKFDVATAKSDGGIIYINGKNANLRNSAFNKGISNKGSGGAIYINQDNAVLYNCTVTNSKAETLASGAVHLAGKNATVNESSFTNNYAKTNGGAMYTAGGGAQVINSNFTENHAGGEGGAICWKGGDDNDRIIGGNFIKNYSPRGGAITWQKTVNSKGNSLFRDIYFEKNHANRHGGAIFIYTSANSIIDNCTFVGNYLTVSGDGGGVYAGDDTQGAVNMLLNRSRFIDNVALSGGGGFASQYRNTTVLNSVFIGNTASFGGSVVMKNSLTYAVVIDGCEFVNSSSIKKNDYGDGGGALFINVKNATVKNSTFENCTSVIRGGAISWGGADGTVYNATFVNCSSPVGGAVYWGTTVGSVGYGANGNITNSTFIYCRATGDGGAIYLCAKDGTKEISDLDIVNCSAVNGGAIYVSSKILNPMTDLRINGCEASENGGAIFINQNINVALSDTDISANKANYGGGIYFNKGSADVSNVNITHNNATAGSGIYFAGNYNTYTNLVNVILLDNQAHADRFDDMKLTYDDATNKVELSGVFYGKDRLMNAIEFADNCSPKVNYSNVTYLDENGIVTRPSGAPSRSLAERGINITIEGYVDNVLTANNTIKTDENGAFKFEINKEFVTSVKIRVYHLDDTYYTYLYGGQYIRTYTIVNISVDDINVTDKAVVKINLTQVDGTPITGPVTVWFNDTFMMDVNVVDGAATKEVDSYLVSGNYTAKVQYNGTDSFAGAINNDTFYVYKFNSKVTINPIVNVTYGTDTVVKYQVENRTTVTYIVRDENGNIVGESTAPAGNSITLSGLVHGNYSIEICNAEDGTYRASNDTAKFKVSKANSTVSAQEVVEVYGTNAVVAISSENATTVDITVYDTNNNVVFANPSAAANGNVVLPILAVGEYSVKLTTNVDGEHISVTNATKVTITPAGSTVSASPVTVVYGTNQALAIVSVNATSVNVVVIDASNKVVYSNATAIANGNLALPILAAGTYTVSLTTNVDANHSSVSNATTVTVTKAPTSVTINPIINGTYSVSDVVIVYEIVNRTDVAIIVKNADTNTQITVPQSNITATTITLGGLSAGNYTVSITNNENQNYTESSASSRFHIKPLTSDITIDPVNNVTYNDVVIVNYKVENGSEVIIKITGRDADNQDFEWVVPHENITQTENQLIIRGLDAGNYTVTITHPSTGNITGDSESQDFTVSRAKSKVTITEIINATYGNDVVIRYAVENKTTVQVVATTKDHTRTIPSGQIDLSVPDTVTIRNLETGEYEITIKNIETKNYEGSQATGLFRVSSYPTTLVLSADDVYVGDDIILKADVTGVDGYPVNGIVTVIYNGTQKTIQIINGKGNISISGLKADHYVVSGVFNANDIYLKSEAGTSFNVKRYETTLQFTDLTVNVGDEVVLVANVDGVDKYPVNGTVNVVGTKSNYTITIVNGTGNVTLPVAEAGRYVLSGVFAENDYYLKSADDAIIVVSRYPTTLNLIDVSVMVGDEVVLCAEVTGVDKYSVNGTVNVVGTKSNYTITIVNGTGNVTLPKLEAGRYVVSGVFAENDYYLKSSAEATILVSRYPTSLNLKDVSVMVGDEVVLCAEVTGVDKYSVNGTVNVVGTKSNYTITIVNGTGNVTLSVLEAGRYVVSGVFAENDYYLKSADDANITVSRYPTTLKFTDLTVNVGDEVVLCAEVTGVDKYPVNGTVNVVGTKSNYTITIVNGTGNVTLPKLEAGRYVLSGVFAENEYYLKSSAEATILVSRYPTTLNLIDVSVNVGDEVVLCAEVTGVDKYPVNGTVNVVGTKSNYTITIVNGTGNVTLPKLEAGRYVVSGVFAENDYYLKSANNATILVSRYPTTLNLIDFSVNVGDEVVLCAEVTGVDKYSVNGTVNVVGTKSNYTITIVNGTGNVTLPVLEAGRYVVSGVFAENDYYLKSSAEATIIVSRYPTSLNLKDVSVMVGDEVVLVAEVTGVDKYSVNGTVNVVGTKSNYTITIVNGTGNVTLPVLEAGHYVVSGVFAENEYYLKSADDANITVSRYPTTLKFTDLTVNVGDEVVLVANVTGVDKYPVNGVVNVVGVRNNYTITIVNGTGNVTLPKLEAGRYVVSGVFAENEYYLKSSAEATILVSRYPTYLNLKDVSVMVGDEVVLCAEVTGVDKYSVNGTVNVVGTKSNYTITIVNGTGNVTLPKLEAGRYVVSGVFAENDYYLKSADDATILVSRYPTTLHIADVSVLVGDEVVLVANVTGVDKYSVNGTVNVIGTKNNYTITIVNGTGNVTLPKLEAGHYVVSGVFAENEYYLKSADDANITVSRHPTTLKFTDLTVNVGDEVVLVANVTGDGKYPVNGVVNVVGTKSNYTIAIVNGTGNVTLPVLEAGRYVVSGVFAENEYYLKSSAEATILVSRYPTSLNLKDVSVNVGDEVVLVAEVTGVDKYSVNGVVNVVGTKSNYTIAIVNGTGNVTLPVLEADRYVVSGVFAENDYYLKSADNATIIVSRYPTTLNIADVSVLVGDEVVLVANVTGVDKYPVNGTVNVVGTKSNYTITIVNGTGNVTLPKLEAGRYVVSGVFAENDYYLKSADDANITVSRHPTTLKFTDLTVNVGDEVVLVANVTGDGKYPVNGVVNVVGTKSNYTIAIVNGTGNVTLPVLGAGHYVLSGVFAENEYYLKSSAEATILVSRYPTSLNLKDVSVMVGDEVVLVAEVTGVDKYPVNGTVNVVGTKSNYTITIVNGTGNVTLPKLEAGRYVVSGVFAENDYYLKSADNATIIVSRYPTTLNLIDVSVLVGDEVVLVANVTGVDKYSVNGTVNVVGTKNNYTITIVNGAGNVTLPKLEAGRYVVSGVFVENEYYLKSADDANITVSRHPTTLKFTDLTVNVGDEVVLVANVTGDGKYPVNGVVNVVGVRNNYTITIVNGTGNVTLPVVEAGRYVLSGVFAENEYYLKSSAEATILVSRYPTTLNLIDVSVNVGDEVVLVANVTGVDKYPVNGVVNVVGTKSNYTITIVNGTGNVTLPKLEAGRYVVSGVFAENDYYLKSSDDATIIVSRYPTTLDLIDVSVYVGDEVVLVANVTGVDKYSVNGTVNVVGTKSNYTIVIVNGAGNVTLPKLEAGRYVVSGVFAENAYYLKSDDRAEIIVSKYPSKLEITIDDVEIGEDVLIKVKVSGNASEVPNGTVTVSINHKDYTINLTNGEGNVSIADLAANYYVVSGIYSGNSIYGEVEAFSNVTVSKHQTKLVINTSDIRVGEDEIINLTVVDINNNIVNASGYVILQGKRQEYNITITGGVGSRTFHDLPADQYIVTGIYYGDDKYLKSENNAISSFRVDKNPSYIIININDSKVDDMVIVEVILPNGASGNVTLSLGGVEYNLTVENGRASRNLRVISVENNYIVTGIYYGNDYYAKSDNSTEFSVTKYPSEIEIELDKDQYSITEQVNITVKVKDGATGNITLTIGSLNQTVELVNGVATWNVSGLQEGRYSVSALYHGNYKFRTNATSKAFSVNMTLGQDVEINATANSIKVGETVYIKVNVTGISGTPTGNITVLIGSNAYSGILDGGSVTIPVAGLNPRDYVAVVTYSGDSTYSSKSTNVYFTVSKWSSHVNVSVESIYVLDLANITVKVTDGATGNVSVMLNHQNYTIELSNGEGHKLISGLAASLEPYLVEVTYMGDNTFDKATNSTQFFVNKYKPAVIVDVNDIMVGQDANITIRVTGNASVNATGEASFVLDGKNHTITITNGVGNIRISNLTENNYVVSVIYYGDDVYMKSEGEGSFKVSRYASKVLITVPEIKVGENLTINITIEGNGDINATGEVDIYLDGKHYSVRIIDGKGSINNISNLSSGKYDFTVTYDGDGNYLKSENGSVAVVNLHAPRINVNATNIKVGETEYVNITVDGDSTIPTGEVQIYVNGEYKLVNLVNGTVLVPISNLPASDGPYIIEAIYYGDEVYDKVTGTGSFTVTKLEPAMSVNVTDINVGEVENVTIAVVGGNVTPTGEVDFIINGKRYNATLNSNGTVTIPVSGLPASDEPYRLEVIYYGDNYYEKITGNASFMVTKLAPEVSVNVTNIRVGDVENVTIAVVGGNVTPTGEVDFIINGKRYNATLNSNGTVTIPVSGLPASDEPYRLEVIYYGDDYYDKMAGNATFTVTKLKPAMSVNVTDIKVGDVENVTIAVVGGNVTPTGEVDFIINGKRYNATLNDDGTVTIPVSGLPASDEPYRLEVIYYGDGTYDKITGNATFSVTKIESEVSVNVTNIKVGDVENVTITVVGADFIPTGEVDFIINGKRYNATLDNNGTVIISVSDLPASDEPYIIEAIYYGDNVYDKNIGSGSFTVTKNTPEVSVDVTNIKVGDVENVTITVVGGNVTPTGEVDFIINGKRYNATLDSNGTVTIPVSGLPASDEPYRLEVIYYGDDYYDKMAGNGTFTVTKLEPEMSVNVTDINVGEVENVTITVVGGNVTPAGEVDFIINGKRYNATLDSNGAVTIPVSGLPASDEPYRLEVIYYGDDYYDKMVGNGTFTVTKLEPEVSVNVTNIRVGDVENVTIAVVGGNVTPTGEVDFIINGKRYNATLDSNGAVIIPVSGLPASDEPYIIEAIYYGDNVYDKNIGSGSFTVIKNVPDVSVEVVNIKVGDVENVKITVVGGNVTPTGEVDFIINGKRYNATLDNNGAVIIPVSDLPASDEPYRLEVIYYGDDYYDEMVGNGTFTVTKLEPAMSVNVTDINVGDVENVTITVGGGNVTPTGEVDFIINGVRYSGNLTDGTVTIPVSDLPASDEPYRLEVIYYGDDTYGKITGNATFSVTKIEPEVSVNVTDIKVGDVENVTITVVGGNVTPAGEVDFIINGKRYNATLTDGAVIIPVSDLPASDEPYIIEAIYYGDNVYDKNIGIGSFTVTKNAPEVSVEVVNIKVGDVENVTITVVGGNVTPTGEVDFIINGKRFNATLNENGTVTIPVSGLPASDEPYRLEVIYYGDDYYDEMVGNGTFTVTKLEPAMSVNVTDINVGVVENVTITVGGGNVTPTGEVDFIINGVRYSGNLTDGTVTIPVSDLPASDEPYRLEVIYYGDDTYSKITGNATFSVTKLEPAMSVNVTDIKVGEVENVTIAVTGGNVTPTGEVDFIINGKRYNATLTDGAVTIPVSDLPASDEPYRLEVIYYGDDYYSKITGNATFSVTKIEPEVSVNVTDIKVGEVENVTITIVGGDITPTGEVNFIINGKTYNGTLDDNGTVTIPVSGLPASDEPYIIEAIYYGDKVYDKEIGSGSFTVTKNAPEVSIDVTNIKVGEVENVTITVVGGDVIPTGEVDFIINGKRYNATLNENGTVTIPVSGLPASDEPYRLEVIYYGDDYYDKMAGNATFTVTKVEPAMSVDVTDINVGEVENVTITVTGGDVTPTGEVDIIINGKRYNATLDENGTVTIPVSGLPASDEPYRLEVIYYGDDTHDKITGNATFSVTKIEPAMSVNVTDINVGDVENVTITVTGGDVTPTGDVDIIINGKRYNATLNENGTVTIPVSDLPASDEPYRLEVIYYGDDTHDKVAGNATFTVTKVEPVMSVDVTNINVGDVENVTVTVTGGNVVPTGEVDFIINGKRYNATLNENGTVTIPVSDLPASDEPYRLEVIYYGDKNYDKAAGNASFTVSQLIPDVIVNADNIDAGETAKIDIIVADGDATGKVQVFCNGNSQIIELVNGKASMNVSGLQTGGYYVEVDYLGDAKYEKNRNETYFTVGYITPEVEINVENITYGEKAEITVKVSDNATGVVTISVGDRTYDVNLTNGTASLIIDDLNAGDYDVKVTYHGDDSHNIVRDSKEFTVAKAQSGISAEDVSADYGDAIEIPVDSQNATGISYKVIDENGNVVQQGTINPNETIADLALNAGSYTVNLTTVTDGNHEPAATSINLTVNMFRPTIEIEVVDIWYGEVEVLNVTCNVAGSVNVTVNGVTETLQLNGEAKDKLFAALVFVLRSENKATWNLHNLAVGQYPAFAVYNGNENYISVNTTDVFNVRALDTSINASSNDIEYGENATITVEVSPTNATGNVTVEIDGKNYTVPVKDGKATIIIPDLSEGNKTAKVYYSGDENHKPSETQTSFTVGRSTTEIMPSAHDIYVGDNETIVVEITKGATGNVTITVDGRNYTEIIRDGKVTFKVEGLKAGKYDVFVRYDGDDDYLPSNSTAQFTVSKYKTDMNVKAPDIKVTEDGKVIVSVTKNATGNVTITIDGQKYTAPVKNGEATFKIKDLKAGKYDIVAVYGGDDTYLPTRDATKFTVSKYTPDVDVNAPQVKVTEDGKVVVSLPKDATGTVTIEVDGKKYTAEVKDGQAVFNIPNLKVGQHSIKVYYSGDDKYSSTATDGDIKVVDDGNGKHEGQSHAGKTNSEGIDLTQYPTGNPILVILLVLMAVGATQIRRLRK